MTKEHCSLHVTMIKDLDELQVDSRDQDKRLTIVEVVQAEQLSNVSELKDRIKANEDKNIQQDLAVAHLTTAIDSLNKTVDKLDSTVNKMLWKMVGGTTVGVGGAGGIGWLIYEFIQRIG